MAAADPKPKFAMGDDDDAAAPAAAAAAAADGLDEEAMATRPSGLPHGAGKLRRSKFSVRGLQRREEVTCSHFLRTEEEVQEVLLEFGEVRCRRGAVAALESRGQLQQRRGGGWCPMAMKQPIDKYDQRE